jgi:hypothetical protein
MSMVLPRAWCGGSEQDFVRSKEVTDAEQLCDCLVAFIPRAEGGNALCFAYDQAAINEGNDVVLVGVLVRSEEVQFSDFLESLCLGGESLTGEKWNVTVLFKEFPHRSVQVIEPFGLY